MTVDVPQDVRRAANDCIGVDFGVVNIATTSDGNQAFFQLRALLTYKAIVAGVDLRIVDPRGMSRTCKPCGYQAQANRKSQAEFVCGQCGHAEHADDNAARNIRSRALVNAPIVAELCVA